MIVRRYGPRVFLTAITFGWGLILLVSVFLCIRISANLILSQGFGFVQHWAVLIALRMILGALEAGTFPGAVYTHKAKMFLNAKESAYLIQRLNRDRGDADAAEAFAWGKFFRPALDFKIWVFGLLFL